MSAVLPDGVAPNDLGNNTQRLRKTVVSSYAWGQAISASNLQDLTGTENTTTLIRKLESNIYQIALTQGVAGIEPRTTENNTTRLRNIESNLYQISLIS